MNKFVFELQGVLEIKQKLEGQAKINFGVARAKLNAEEEKRDFIIGRLDGFRDELTQQMTGKIDILEIGRLQDAVSVMEEQLASQEMVVKRAEKQLELMRSRLNTVVMERKTIEKLREKQFDEYMKEYNAEERKQVDELISYRHSTPTDEQTENVAD